MKPTAFLLALFILLGISVPGFGQLGFEMPPGRKQVEIPFEYSNNFIIVTVRFNGFLPLRFIFDTGAEFTILTKREITDMFRMQYAQTFQVAGSDLQTPLTAYLVRNVRLEIPEKAYAPSEDILVLDEDYFKFEEYAGVSVHGILSANTFARYLIKINYQRRVITLYERGHYEVPGEFAALPVEVYKNKIYLRTSLNVRPDSSAQVKLLIDTGAGLPLLLFTNTHPLLHPPSSAIPSNIGMGLGGFIQGYSGRIQQLELNPYAQHEIVTYFQEIDTTQRLSYLNFRNGLLGNAILSHFQVILDYQEGLMWLRPTKYYKEKFEYDRSGVSVIASGKDLNVFVIQTVVPGSPAATADLRPGDVILKIGSTPASFLSLSGIQSMFLKKPGKKLRVVVRRGDEKLRKQIVLRDLL